jgi:hypothetical protein
VSTVTATRRARSAHTEALVADTARAHGAGFFGTRPRNLATRFRAKMRHEHCAFVQKHYAPFLMAWTDELANAYACNDDSFTWHKVFKASPLY